MLFLNVTAKGPMEQSVVYELQRLLLHVRKVSGGDMRVELAKTLPKRGASLTFTIPSCLMRYFPDPPIERPVLAVKMELFESFDHEGRAQVICTTGGKALLPVWRRIDPSRQASFLCSSSAVVVTKSNESVSIEHYVMEVRVPKQEIDIFVSSLWSGQCSSAEALPKHLECFKPAVSAVIDKHRTRTCDPYFIRSR